MPRVSAAFTSRTHEGRRWPLVTRLGVGILRPGQSRAEVVLAIRAAAKPAYEVTVAVRVTRH
jgi:hypothetical protein